MMTDGATVEGVDWTGPDGALSGFVRVHNLDSDRAPVRG